MRLSREWPSSLATARAVAWAASCGGSPQGPVGALVRDSSGVRIVEGLQIGAPNTMWSVPSAPQFRVGWGPEDVQFETLNTGALLPDGRVVVGDSGSGFVYLMSAEGELIARIGGPGEGPGEFSRILKVVHLGGDTILVQDSGNFRVTAFVGADFAWDQRFENYFAEAMYDLNRQSGIGGYVLTPGALLARGLSGTVGWKNYPVLRLSDDFETVDTIVEVGLMLVPEKGDRNPIRHFGTPIVAGDALAYARTSRPEVRWLDLTGALRQIARLDVAPEDADDVLWNEYERGLRSRTRNADPAVVEQRLSDARRDFKGPRPFFRSAYGDQLGNVWLSEYRISGVEAASYWVITRDGESVYNVVFPRDLRILDISADRVLGVEEDEFDVQALVVYPLEKSGH